MLAWVVEGKSGSHLEGLWALKGCSLGLTALTRERGASHVFLGGGPLKGALGSFKGIWVDIRQG